MAQPPLQSRQAAVRHQDREYRRSALAAPTALLLLLTALCGAVIGLGALAYPSLGDVPLAPPDRAPLLTGLARLDGQLHSLAAFFDEAREIEDEARLLARLDPVAQTAAPPPPRLGEVACVGDENLARSFAASSLHMEQMLVEARSLTRSYAQVLDGMKRHADLWAGIPSLTPLEDGEVTSRFGIRRDPFTGTARGHKGIDISAPSGSAVRASAYGRVVRAGYVRGYGKLVEIDHGNGLTTRYAHNARVLVRSGDRVRRGQIIAQVGQTGRASAPHLHYEVLVNGRPVDPWPHVFQGGALAD